MTVMTLARPAAALVAVLAFAACSRTTSTTTTTPSAAAMPFTPLMVAEGDSLFHARSCKNCHGADAMGAKNGPNLVSGPMVHTGGRYEQIVRIVTSGVPLDSIKDKSHTKAMGGHGGNPPLTDMQIRSVAAYVFSLSHR